VVVAGFWAELPAGGVASLVGASPEAIALALEPLPAGAPAVLTFRPAAEPSSSRVVDALLDHLEAAALDLYPAWLPGAGTITGPAGAGAAAVRALAAAKAAATAHFGPFLADLAVRAVGAAPAEQSGTAGGGRAAGGGAAGGGSGGGRFPAEVRAAGLARVIADSFGRAGTALLVVGCEPLEPSAERALLAAAEWLAHHGGIGVWLTGAGPWTRDRVPGVPVRLPEHVASLTGTGPAGAAPPTAPGLAIPAPAGRPHPASKAEQALEAALAAESWSAGRVWNQTFQLDPLSNPIRVDLMWPAERCAIEIDGAEHRGQLHYDADRRRDVQLQLAGFAVLRFTNRQTLADIGTVLAQIQRFISIRRDGEDGHAR
jgi:very-short-patch-repair endonuclease